MKTKYDYRQNEIATSMKDLETHEKDLILKNKLYTELRKKDTSVNERTSLQFSEQFGDGQIHLCEDCFVLLYNHKSKRTFESWKSDLKRKTQFDANAADIQNRLPQKRKQRNWYDVHDKYSIMIYFYFVICFCH